jgi:hypothetical protein
MSVSYIYYKELFLYAKTLLKPRLGLGRPERGPIPNPYKWPRATPTKLI